MNLIQIAKGGIWNSVLCDKVKPASLPPRKVCGLISILLSSHP